MSVKKNVVSTVELIFKILYLVNVLISFNPLCAGSNYLTIFNYFLVALCAVVILYRLIHFKNYIKTPNLLILVAFCVSFVISAFINRSYGLVENIQSLIWTTIQFGLLYACDSTRSSDEYKKELKILCFIFCGYVFLANIVGLVMFIKNYGAFGNFSPVKGNTIGFIWGRLWGVYLDPNYGSVYSAASIVLSICFFAKNKGQRLLRTISVLNIILCYIYIILSDSRTGFVCAIVGVAFTMYLLICDKKVIKTNLFLKKALCLVISCAISFGCYAAFQGVKIGYNTVAEKIYYAQLEKNYVIDSNGQKVPGKNSNIVKPSIITGRDSADTESDISNRRFSLWKSGIEVWETAPIFGVSQRNILNYAKQNLPNTYFVNNDYDDFDSTHNLFLDVLVSQGVIGFLIIILFFGLSAFYLIKKITIEKKKSKFTLSIYVVAILGTLSVLASSSMFVLDLIYLNSPTSFMFWAMFGYLMHYIKNYNKAN